MGQAACQSGVGRREGMLQLICEANRQVCWPLSLDMVSSTLKHR
jgi:hypothetical protein